MKKIAVIIYHPGRNNDYRIDIYDVLEEMTGQELHDYVMSKMLGPFQILSMTDRIEFNCKIQSKP